jgi:uncharacterized membrane protein
MEQRIVTRPLTIAGIVAGVGLGGFVDGILFHQIFQLHNMLTGRLPADTLVNAEINMFWDGIFHLFTWIMTVLGIVLLFRTRFVPHLLWSGKAFLGACLLGWGLFNVIEGVINHHLLHLHHVVEQRGESIFDVLFLLSGVLLMLGGGYLIRSARNQARELAHPLLPAQYGVSCGEPPATDDIGNPQLVAID